jgi:hypothetical protein
LRKDKLFAASVCSGDVFFDLFIGNRRRRKLNNGAFFALECGEFVNFSLHCLWTNEFFPSLSSGVLHSD